MTSAHPIQSEMKVIKRVRWNALPCSVDPCAPVPCTHNDAQATCTLLTQPDVNVRVAETIAHSSVLRLISCGGGWLDSATFADFDR